MGRLTEDMTRLHDEIGGLRNAREVLTKDLEAFADDLREGVSAMRAHLRNAHSEMAQTAKAGREAFTSGLRESIAGLRHEFAADVAGARLAFCGSSRAGRRTAAGKPRARARRKSG